MQLWKSPVAAVCSMAKLIRSDCSVTNLPSNNSLYVAFLQSVPVSAAAAKEFYINRGLGRSIHHVQATTSRKGIAPKRGYGIVYCSLFSILNE